MINRVLLLILTILFSFSNLANAANSTPKLNQVSNHKNISIIKDFELPNSGESLAALTIAATPSSALEVGVTYSQTNVASGGAGTYVYSLASGTIPAGLILNLVTGTVYGTPTTAGAFTYTIRVTDLLGARATVTTSGTILPAVTLSATASTSLQVGTNYLQTNAASNGTGTYSYTVSAGALPNGLALNASTGAVFGTPTTAGAFNYTIKVTDSYGAVATATISGTIVGLPISITAVASSNTKVQTSYLQTNTASGGNTPYVYSVSAGALPSGLTLNASTGVVSGLPLTAGAFNYTIRVTDSLSATATVSTSGVIASAISLSIAATASANLQVGALYLQTNVASGGTLPYTYSLASGSLPAGVTLDTTTGIVSGVPTSGGAVSYVIRVTDNLGATATVATNVNIALATALTVAATASVDLKVGTAYLQTNVASGGVGPYVYSVASGTLPAGVTLNASTGVVSGTPTTAGVYSYTIRVTDSLGVTADVAVNATIHAALELSLAATPSVNLQAGTAYLQTNVASGGTAPYVYSLSAGALPSGLNLNVSTGIVSGTPTNAGAFSYTITVTDSLGFTANATTSGTIASATALTLAANASANLKVGTLYLQTNVASGGTAPYAYNILSGSLPAGLSLDASTGIVSGTPTTAGAFSYTVQVTDNLGVTANVNVSATIAALADLSLTASPSANMQVGIAYSQTNVASGGLGPYVYSLLSGTLPTGVTLNVATGTVSGTPTVAGAFSYTIRVTDSLSATANASTSGTIFSANALTISSSASASSQVGVAYSQTNTASGGTIPYIYSVTSGSLPAGVSLDAATGAVSGTPTTPGAFSYTIRVTDSLSR